MLNIEPNPSSLCEPLCYYTRSFPTSYMLRYLDSIQSYNWWLMSVTRKQHHLGIEPNVVNVRVGGVNVIGTHYTLRGVGMRKNIPL